MKTHRNVSQTRSKIAIFVACVAIVIVITSCATTKPKETPFKSPKATIRETVKTVAVFRVSTPSDLENRDPVEAEFSGLVAAKLREGGFSVVEPSEVMPIMGKERKATGGLFDPETGKIDKAKYRTYWDNVLQELKTKFSVDAVLLCAIVVRLVGYEARTGTISSVSWDGTSESIFAGSGTFLKAMFGGKIHSGRTKALSLKATLQDTQGRDLFVNYGGIQLALKLPSPSKPANFQAVPRAELFADHNRNQNAVNIALDPLVK